MEDWIFGVFEGVMKYIVMPVLIIAIVLLILALPFILHATWKQSKSPTFTLHKNEWACTNMQRIPITTYIQSGNVMVPVTTYSNECHQWSKQP
jgi:hypothetical protein